MFNTNKLKRFSRQYIGIYYILYYSQSWFFFVFKNHCSEAKKAVHSKKYKTYNSIIIHSVGVRITQIVSTETCVRNS